ncbi:hypothetical protein [Dietzia natronolimnaea]|uniref:hypothetical protein n=1 Tax=Dietzia natronolimnaea TaxID=161920 RepID=UPI0015FC2EDD|nr:hypothetical protein [Dietzia natronolimnaea]MBB1037843.1 hypothetical protein [Dietzia natronolimnaea]
MTLLSQAAQATTNSPNDFWWAQPGATLLGGALVFAAAWVAYAAQANTRKQERSHHQDRLTEERNARAQERTHHLDRLDEERKARAELVKAQREEWEARIIHERMEARRTEAIRNYSNILELAAFCKHWATENFDPEIADEMPDMGTIQLTPILCPPQIDKSLGELGASVERRDADGINEAYDILRETIRTHLKTFDSSPRRSVENQP